MALGCDTKLDSSCQLSFVKVVFFHKNIESQRDGLSYRYVALNLLL